MDSKNVAAYVRRLEQENGIPVAIEVGYEVGGYRIWAQDGP